MKNSKGLYIKREYNRIPRKLKKKIPKDTFYCYIPLTKPGFMEDGKWGYKIKLCPFSTYIKIKDMKPIPSWCDQEYIDKYGDEETNWCKLIKGEIEDQCKSCGLKQGKW